MAAAVRIRPARWVVLLALGLLLVTAVALYVFMRPAPGDDINSFDACVKAGNPVQESYPPACNTEDGRRFVSEPAVVPQPPSEGRVPQR